MVVKLDFLDPKLTYTAEIYRDSEGANDIGNARFKIAIEKQKVMAADTRP